MGSPWEMGLSAGRDCAKGDQEVYTLFDDYKSRKAYVSPNLPEAYRDFYQKRCANSFALNGQYDFGLWRLNVIASSQRVHTARHWPLDAYFPQFGEHWKQNTQEVRLSTRPSEAGRRLPVPGMRCSVYTGRKWTCRAATSSTWCFPVFIA